MTDVQIIVHPSQYLNLVQQMYLAGLLVLVRSNVDVLIALNSSNSDLL